MRRTLLLLPLAALAACGPAPLLMTVPPLAPEERVASAFDSVELIEVSLPAYADTDDIFLQGQGGALTQASGAVWADDPSRALTLDLARTLGRITGARVAPEPYPFEGDPAARVDIRVETFAPDLTRGAFVIRGQFFVATEDGEADRSGEFEALGPLPQDPGPAAIAAARAQATLALAQDIAARGLR